MRVFHKLYFIRFESRLNFDLYFRYPRNVPIMHIENAMLEYLQSENFGIKIHAKNFDKEDLTQWEKDGFNILVLSEGNVGFRDV